MLPSPPDGWDIDGINASRVQAVAAHGFTERQARFLVTVMLHAGVFVERQYCAFAGIRHGQKTHDVLQKLVTRRYATPLALGPLHSGRLFHLHFKPLYATIGEPDNRHRKPASLGRMIERVMILDGLLDDRTFTWLGSERDKRSYFVRRVGDRLKLEEFPHLTFGHGPTKTTRYFPDKLPIGIQPDRQTHVFVYLITRPEPMDFRLFLLHHAELLRALFKWTIRVLVPPPFASATGLYQQAAREHLATPLAPSAAEEVEWWFRERQRRGRTTSATPDERLLRASQMFRAPRFRALYRAWVQLGDSVVWAAKSKVLQDALERREGSVEFVRLSRQYLHLSSLVGTS